MNFDARRTSRTPSERVIALVADREGVPSTDLDPLYDVVDPEALDALFEPTRTTDHRRGTVQFAYAGYTVTIDVTDDVVVTVERESASSSNGQPDRDDPL